MINNKLLKYNAKEMEKSSNLTLKTINELLGFNFIIPYFQRGYRWNQQQVNDLLDDIWEFTLKENKLRKEFYCLQPIVVVKIKEKYSILDGQQRLTTIHLLLSYFKSLMEMFGKDTFSLEYETRKDSGEFLKNIDFNRKQENIDYFHICEAYETIDMWFQAHGKDKQVDILKALINDDSTGNNVKVIWYEVDLQSNQIDIFTRINMGKIPLTNAELIKALFLLKNNFDGNDKTIELLQIDIANTWDRIEYELQEDEFWYFLNNGSFDYENRIEFIFDLYSNKDLKIKDKDYTFRFFLKLLNEKEVRVIWQDLKYYFMIFQEWFNQREYYHLVGYLIAVGLDIKVLKVHSKDLPKSEFIEYLVYMIKKQVEYNISELTYYEDKKQIRKILLLFNVITFQTNLKSNIRFEFGRYKKEKWDIEHIHSVQSEMPQTQQHQSDWLNEVFTYSDEKKLKRRIDIYLSQTEISKKESFEKLYMEILKKYSENGHAEDINDLSNLTLLDAGTNRGYKNAVFPIKRKKIMGKDRNGTFIPPSTKNVFLKYYSDSLDQMSFWGKTDRKAYLDAIIKLLKPYLPSQNS